MATQTEQLTLAQVTALVRLTQRVEALNTIHSGDGAPPPPPPPPPPRAQTPARPTH